MNNTTRRFPRSLSDAFPDERAYCIEGPRRTALDLVPMGIGLIVALFAGVALFFKLVEVFQ